MAYAFTLLFRFAVSVLWGVFGTLGQILNEIVTSSQIFLFFTFFLRLFALSQSLETLKRQLRKAMNYTGLLS